MRITILIFVICVASYASSNCEHFWSQMGQLDDLYSSIEGKCGNDLKWALRRLIDDHKDLGYDRAREEMFGKIDNNEGEVCSVYSPRCVDTWGVPNHTIMNCEHSWPQSLGATGDAKSDLHHLYPVMSRMNSRRGNRPFCEVEEITYDEWGSLMGRSEFGTLCFEPPEDHKGDLARSMLYFSIRYSKKIDSEQEDFFRKWNLVDPVSEKEMERNEAIYKLQRNRNPFVDYPGLVDIIDDF